MIISSRENAIVKQLRAECAKLDDVTETITWGHPIFRVGGPKGKMFCGVGDHKAAWGIGFNVGKDVQREMLKKSPKRFFPTPYAAHVGWVSMRMNGRFHWTIARRLLKLAHARAVSCVPKSKRVSRGGTQSANRFGR